MGRMNLLSGGIGELPTKEFLCGGEFSDGGGVEFGVGGGGSGVGEQRGLQVRKPKDPQKRNLDDEDEDKDDNDDDDDQDEDNDNDQDEDDDGDQAEKKNEKAKDKEKEKDKEELIEWENTCYNNKDKVQEDELVEDLGDMHEDDLDEPVSKPKQSHDCGFHVLLYIKGFEKGEILNYDKEKLEIFRITLAADLLTDSRNKKIATRDHNEAPTAEDDLIMVDEGFTYQLEQFSGAFQGAEYDNTDMDNGGGSKSYRTEEEMKSEKTSESSKKTSENNKNTDTETEKRNADMDHGGGSKGDRTEEEKESEKTSKSSKKTSENNKDTDTETEKSNADMDHGGGSKGYCTAEKRESEKTSENSSKKTSKKYSEEDNEVRGSKSMEEGEDSEEKNGKREDF
ncbi:probable ATP-dependent RNA helicase ddx56 [Panicum hallii]|uniref:probable ATP-dependent RNA helicase ddx56 n=1 Tax=Panicum hallii TaxID=206008 RepID=UPI000DF4E6A1|nr:probable ATP-dependent RNA helicase ddx56 [Panicum hallii]